MTEKRIYTRQQLIYYMKIIDRDTEELLGFLVDITPEGIMIMSESPVEVDKTFNLNIQMDKESSSREFLPLTAKSKWCKKEVYADFYDAGFELLSVQPEDIKEIENIIEKLCFKD